MWLLSASDLFIYHKYIDNFYKLLSSYSYRQHPLKLRKTIGKVMSECVLHTNLTLVGQVVGVRGPEMEPETKREEPLLYEMLWSNSTV